MRKWLGAFFLWTGVAVGALVGAGMLLGLKIGDVPWYMTVAVVKITLAGSAGLMTAGAILLRLHRRSEARELAAASASAAIAERSAAAAPPSSGRLRPRNPDGPGDSRAT